LQADQFTGKGNVANVVTPGGAVHNHQVAGFHVYFILIPIKIFACPLEPDFHDIKRFKLRRQSHVGKPIVDVQFTAASVGEAGSVIFTSGRGGATPSGRTCTTSHASP